MKTHQRLIALDILRGLTIMFMIIVNDPGSWAHVYPILLHADWNGITPTDYIFPMFLFIVGSSIVLSLDKQKERLDHSALIRKILWRSTKIYAVGLFLWLYPSFDFERIRWVGVLPRIAVVYGVCALLYLFTSMKTQLKIIVGILVGYTILMVYVPIPGLGTPDLSVPEKNWANYLDSLLIPGRMWKGTWDPEGFLSTFPAIATGLLGIRVGTILQQQLHTLQHKLVQLFLLGTLLLFLGDISQYIFPLNKSIWSSSFTLVTSGISCLCLAGCIYLCDIKGWGSRFKVPLAFGMNAIFSYVLAGLLYLFIYSDRLWGVGLDELYMKHLDWGLFSKKFLSLSYAVLYVGLIWVPTHYLYKRKIYIKL